MDLHGCTENETALLDSASGCDTNKTLPGPAREDDDPRARLLVSEHLVQALDLVRSNGGGWFEIQCEVLTEGVTVIIVLSRKRWSRSAIEEIHYHHGYFDFREAVERC